MYDILFIGMALLSFISTLLSIFTLNKLFNVSVEIAAFKASTHSVQYVGATDGKVTVKDSIGDFEISEFQKDYREEAQHAYPEFATTAEDLELRGL